MQNVVLRGRGRAIDTIDERPWREGIARSGLAQALQFMTPDHHRVRNFVVDALLRCDARGLSVDDVARGVALPARSVDSLLDDLERHLFFLVRRNRRIVWAFPVTVDKTPHELQFGSGETVFGA